MANKNASLRASAGNLALVATCAFREGESRARVVEAVKVAIGNSRSEKHFALVRARYIIGRMAARIASNASETVRLAGAEVAFNSAGANGTGKLAKGKRRRTPEEEAAYAAARVAWGSVLKDAGIKSLDKRGGGSASHPKKRGTKKPATKKTGNDNRQVAPTLMQPEKIAAFLTQQAAMLLSFCNKNAKRMTIEQRNAIETFHMAVVPVAKAD